MSMVVAKLAVAIAFTLVYIYTAEMFPTTLRYVDGVRATRGNLHAWSNIVTLNYNNYCYSIHE